MNLHRVELWYLAHPVGAADRAGVEANLARAGRWLAFLLAVEPNVAIIAPWLATMLAGVQDDANPEHRRRGMRDNLAAARRCDGIVLCGGRISIGMGDEIGAVLDESGAVSDLTAIGDEPPPLMTVTGPVTPGVMLEHGRRAWNRRQNDRSVAWSRP